MVMKLKITELGKFGMGGTYASLALASKKTTLTIGSEGTLQRSYDLDIIQQKDSWGSIVSDPDPELLNELKDFIGSGNGTLIRLEELSSMRSRRKGNFESGIHLAIGKAYCDAIESGNIVFEVNGKTVEPVDPLLWNHTKTQQLFSGFIFPNLPTEDPLKNLKMKIVSIIDVPPSEKQNAEKNQGVYIYRNGRLIKSAVTNCEWWQGSWPADARYRDCRIGLYFDASLDKYFGITHLKDSIDVEQSFGDKLRAKIKPYGTQCWKTRRQLEKDRTKEGRKVTASRATDVLNDLISDTKRKTSTKRKAETKRVISGKDNVVELPKSVTLDNYQYSIAEEGIGSLAPFARREHVENGKCMIKINTDHPFVSRFHTQADQAETQMCFSIIVNALMRACDVHHTEDTSDDLVSNFDEYLRLLAKKVD